MARNAIESDFRSSKMGGGGASQWPACEPFGDIHNICPWANTPILVYLSRYWEVAVSEICS